MRRLFSFPNPVNEVAARSVAALVLLTCLLTLATQWMWLTIPLAYGFLARVAAGPRFSLFGQLATRLLSSPFRPKLVPGPPKRFAQAMGLVMSLAAVGSYYLAGSAAAALVFVGLIAVAATLESVFAYCLGCAVFAYLMRRGLIPESACEACNDVQARLAVSG